MCVATFSILSGPFGLKSSRQKKASPAMSSLRGYSGLNSKDQVTSSDVIEMAVLEKWGFLITRKTDYLSARTWAATHL